MRLTYSAYDAGRIVGMTASAVLHFRQMGLVTPSERVAGRRSFGFVDLVCIEVAKTLIDRGISVGKTQQLLAELRIQLASMKQSLGNVQIVATPTSIHLRTRDEMTAALPAAATCIALDSLKERIATLGHQSDAGALGSSSPTRERPSTAYEWFRFGLRKQEEGELDAATAAYLRTLELDAAFASALANLGGISLARGETSQAVDFLKRALESDPRLAEAHFNLGCAQFEQGAIADAITSWQETLRLAPRITDAHFQLGVAYARTRNYANARKQLDLYLEADPASDLAEQVRALMFKL